MVRLGVADAAILSVVLRATAQELRLVPKTIVIGHAVLAVLGFGLLAKAAFLG